jgi:AP-1 complex subunit beta-1
MNTELQNELDSVEVDHQKETMKQIIASMTIGIDVKSLFPNVVKHENTEYRTRRGKAGPYTPHSRSLDSDAMDKNSFLIRALAVRTMGCIRVNQIVSYLCETLTYMLKDTDRYVMKTACMCVAKLYNTSPELVKENGFIETLTAMLTDGNAIVVANSLAVLAEVSTLFRENHTKIRSKTLREF